MTKDRNANILMLVVISIAIGAISAVISLFIGRKIAKPVEATSLLVQKISKGDFTVHIPSEYLTRKDEIGLISQSLEQMVNNLRNMIREVMTESQQTNELPYRSQKILMYCNRKLMIWLQ